MMRRKTKRDGTVAGQPMVLQVDEESTAFTPNRINRTVAKVTRLLDAYPVGKVLPTRLLAQRVGASLLYIRGHACDPALAPYRFDIHRQVWWGNPETVRAWRAQRAEFSGPQSTRRCA